MKKYILIILLISIIIVFVSCTHHDFAFYEGYFYNNESIKFMEESDIYSTQELYIEEIKLEFNEITTQEFNESNNINVMENYVNKKVYCVTFLLRFNVEDELRHYDFESIPAGGGIPNSYAIRVEFVNDEIDVTGSFELRLFFYNINKYSGYRNPVDVLEIRHNTKNDELKNLIKWDIESLEFKTVLSFIKK